ncbi:hypothetical protein [Caminibacter pacificus]
MNKLFLTALASTYLFAQTEIYTYTVFMDYREYENGSVIDKDYTNFGDLNGIGIFYKSKTKPLKFTLRAEFAGGESTYEGSTWDGTPLKNRQSGVYIFNFESGVGVNYFFLTLGYREWNRGKSNYSGDYDEKYYWPYFGIRYDYHFFFNNFAFNPKISYQAAISPKLKVYLGNDPVLNLGYTDGAYIDLPLYFKTGNTVWYIFYKYQYWHISKSDYAVLQTSTNRTLIYEPESITRNQYLGAGFVFRF